MKSNTYILIALFYLGVLKISYCQMYNAPGNEGQTKHFQIKETNDSILSELEHNVEKYYSENLVEKVFLHTNKDVFSIAEDVFYSSYVVLGSNHSHSMESSVIHVDLISSENQIIFSQTNELVNGRGAGSLKMSKDLRPGKYQIRAYTDWMRNFDHDFFFSKTIEVVNGKSKSSFLKGNSEKVDLQFFPEGGQLVDDLPVIIAFKAIGTNGYGKEIEGTILDSQAKVVGSLNTLSRGMGAFLLRPKLNEQYIAVLDDGTKHNLPKVYGKGYVLTVDNQNPDYLIVQVQASEEVNENPFYLLGHVRNRKHLHVKFKFGGKTSTKFKVSKKELPSGVLVLTLFDQNKRAWCERLVFVNNQNELRITTKTTKKKFEKRDKIDLEISVLDLDGKPVSADLSIAVTDASQVVKDKYAGNILTNLLLESDLRGHVRHPSQLFADQKKPTLYVLDLIMLTHGWRKFNWPQILKGKYIPKKYKFSKGLKLSGTINSSKNEPLRNSKLKVLGKSESEISMYETKTDSMGRFLIDDFNFTGETEIVLNGYDSKNKPLDIKVELDKKKERGPLPEFKDFFFDDKMTEKFDDDVFSKQAQSHPVNYSSKTINLEEVTLTGNKTKKRQPASPSIYGITPDEIVYADEYANNELLQLVSRFSGVRVAGDKVGVRGGGGPLWVVDGMAIHNYDRLGNEVISSVMVGPQPVPDLIKNFDYYSVERVEVLKGPSAGAYGMRGANGVVLVYTKKGSNRPSRVAKSPSFNVYGYDESKEFYTPKYDVLLDSHTKLDYRSTLYWSPSISTDKKGKAIISFFNSDSAKQIQVVINTLSSNGQPGTFIGTFGNKY